MIDDRGTVRVFVALELPDMAKDVLKRTMTELQGALPSGIRWVSPDGIHLTLKFLGDVETGLVGGIMEAMEQAAGEFEGSGLELGLSGLGVFPNRREPRVLWAGVKGNLAELASLQLSVDETISRRGFAREGRPFRPHLTLGRVRDRVQAADRKNIGSVISRHPLNSSVPWLATEMHLIRSTLTSQGAIYDSLGKAVFRKSD